MVNSRLSAYASLAAFIGPRLQRDTRHEDDGRPQLVAATLSSWARKGNFMDVGGHNATALFVAAQLTSTQLPKELIVVNAPFPAVLAELDDRAAFLDHARRVNVIAQRLRSILTFAPALRELLSTVDVADKFGTLRHVANTITHGTEPNDVPSIMALDRQLAAGNHDLAARAGETDSSRLDRITVAARRGVSMGT